MGQFIDDGLLKDYFDEAYSQIELIEENLLILEKDINNKEAIDELFRAYHTLKGGSATVQMDEITDFTHLLEDVLDEIRENKIKVNDAVIDIMLSALDLIKNMVNERSKGKIYSKDYSIIISSINKILKGEEKGNTEKTAKGKSSGKASSNIEGDDELLNDPRFKLSEYDLLEINDSNPDGHTVYRIIVVLDESNPMKTVSGIQIFTSLRDIGAILKTVPEFDEIYSDNFYKEIMYVLASDKPTDKIKSFLFIPDTTEKVIVSKIDMSAHEMKVEKKDAKPIVKEKMTVKEREDAKKKTEKIEVVKEMSEAQIKKIVDEQKEDENKIDDIALNADIDEKQKGDGDISGKAVASSILRVDSARIDALLNLVSEVVINKAFLNQINYNFSEMIEQFILNNNTFKDELRQFFDEVTQLINEDTDNEILENIKTSYNKLNKLFDTPVTQLKTNFNQLKSNALILDRISSSLQEGVMKVRMVPVKQIFNRFPRLVRDLSKRLGKKVEIVIKGEDTEVDKAMIDYLSDPLIHIVRNSIDHGIESSEEREKAGKNPIGKLELSAASEGNIINISVTDDGKGINVEKVKDSAVKHKLISSDSYITEQEAYNLIFEPGFSTAAEVTSVSGRGVGLDVVKKNIEKLNGSIKVISKVGEGTTFSLKLPLTLAIIQGLMVEVLKDKYIIPISSVIESVRITPDQIKSIDNYEVINVRDEIFSLIRLSRLFKYTEEMKNDFYFIIIVGSGSRKLGLLVDNVIGEEDIVIKPLRDKYTNTPGIAGATILGDGTVSLILNISQLIELGEKIVEKK